MNRPPTASEAERLRRIFTDAGYTDDRLESLLGTRLPPPEFHEQSGQFLKLAEGSSALHLLARWFFLGQPDPGALPGDAMDLLLDVGLLTRSGDLLAPTAIVAPIRELLIASDLHRCIDETEEHILALHAPAVHLLDFAIPGPFETVLDLCSGNALHAVAVANSCERVVATDLFPRAADYGRFNAALNGRQNIEFLTGDRLTPVEGRTFDLVLSNPPFEISASREDTFRENSLHLDSFCRELARTVPAHLNEGGYFQMPADWVSIGDPDWKAPLEKWFEGTGCDAWCLLGVTRLPATYARDRAAAVPGSNEDEWQEHFEECGVVAIHGGLIAMRKRTGRNWLRFDRLPYGLGRPVGESVRQGFLSRDFLLSHTTPNDMLTATPRVSPATRLIEKSKRTEGGWQATEIELSLAEGLRGKLGIDETTKVLLGLLDGKHSLGEVCARLATGAGADRVAVQAQVVPLVGKLIDKGFLLPT